MRVWLDRGITRIFPGTAAGSTRALTLDAAPGTRVSFQAAFRNDHEEDPCRIRVTVAAPDGVVARVRRQGFVPVPHRSTRTPSTELDGLAAVPGLVPDVLFDEDTAVVGPAESAAFWINLTVDGGLRPGSYPVTVTVERLRADRSAALEETDRLDARLDVLGAAPSGERGLRCFHWFYSDTLLDWYRLRPFEERYWALVEPYARNLLEHGTDALYVPLFTPPTDGERRPSQLLKISGEAGRPEFDFAAVQRYLDMAKRLGFRHFEWPHLFSQWGAKWAIGVYRGHGAEEQRLWPAETGGLSDTYRTFLSRFLPAFRSFLEGEGVFDGSYFHVSDEPHGDEDRARYVEARKMLGELAPWMKTMDAVSEVSYGEQGLTDVPVPVISRAGDYIRKNIPCFTYFCCSPRGRYINRLMDTPLVKIRALGWVLYRHSALISGFLHWGYNYWYRSQTRTLIDPFTVSDGCMWPSWAHGDTFVVYPGAHGPLDSLRWEVFADGLADYALLRSRGVAPDEGALLAIEDFDRFPRDPYWYVRARREALER